MTSEAELICCYINQGIAQTCQQRAVWHVIDPGKHPAEGTVDSCDLHVWELLTDAAVQFVYEIDGPLEFEVKRKGLPGPEAAPERAGAPR